HWHRREGPEPHGLGVRYVGSSTAGAVSGGATVGPLNGVADLTVLRIDAANRRPLDYRVVQVGTDASVELGPWYAFPERPAAETAGAAGLAVDGATEDATDGASDGATEHPTDGGTGGTDGGGGWTEPPDGAEPRETE